MLYRLGGREAAIRSAGTFETEKLAKLRRDLVAGWIASGRDPAAELAKLTAAATPARTYRAWATAYEASRIDAAVETKKNLGSHLKRLNDLFGDRDPARLTVADQIEAVAELAAALKPSSVARYWATHRLILDFAGVTPNPARDPAVKLPSVVYADLQPPTANHFLAMLAKLPERWRLALVVAEQTAMTVGELAALEWGDVDAAEQRFRLRRATVKAQLRARARWVQVPDWLMELVEDTCPLEDRVTGRRVFPGFTGDAAKNAMARACKQAGIPHYSPHELRHRRLSLWHGQGVPAKQLAERAGHAKASMTLDTYSHVMPLDEAPIKELKDILVRSR